MRLGRPRPPQAAVQARPPGAAASAQSWYVAAALRVAGLRGYRAVVVPEGGAAGAERLRGRCGSDTSPPGVAALPGQTAPSAAEALGIWLRAQAEAVLAEGTPPGESPVVECTTVEVAPPVSEARLVAAEQQTVERQRQEGALQNQLAEARTVIDRLSAQATAVPPDPPGPPAAATTTGQNGSALVETRALGKPLPFAGGATTEGKPDGGFARQQWSFTFREQPISNISMEPHGRRLSAQIFYVLALTCRGRALSVVQRAPEGWGIEAWRQLCIEFEPKLPSRFQGMLQQLLDPVRGPDAVENIYAWERKLKQYEEQSGDTMADTIKLATLNSKLLEGNLRTHLNLQAGRLQTYEAARNEAISYLRATASQEQEPVPMDLSPVTGELYPMTMGGKGKGKGKGKSSKGKDHDGKGKNKRVCFYCAKPNHAKQECRVFAPDRTNKDIKPDKAGRYMGKPVDKVTGNRADAEKGDMAALTALPDDDDYDEADGFVFALTDEVIVMGDSCALEGDEFDLLFDTRAAKSVCPPTWAPEVAVEECRGTALYQADGNEIAHYGRKEVSMVDQSSGEQLTVNFEELATVVRDSVGKNRSIELRRKTGIFVIPARRCSSSGELCAATEKDEEPDDLEESEDARPALTKALAPWPSAEEKAGHELTHCPHRAWCRYCLTGQATEDPHRSQSKESTAAKLALDYCFLAREGELRKATVLVFVLGPPGAVGATQFVLFYLEACGAGEGVLRADQGPAIQALLVELRRRRRVEHHRTTIEKSTKHDSKANGGIEVVVRRVESLTRTCVAVIEDKYKTKVTSQSVSLPWLVRHSAYIITRFVLKSECRSAWATIRGKEFTSRLAGVGETVDFKLIRKDQSKLDPRWASGVFLGRRGESEEVVMGTARGKEFTRSFKRRAESERWIQEEFRTFIGVPWNPRAPTTEAPVVSARRRCITRALTQEHGESPVYGLPGAEIFRKQAEQLVQAQRASGAGSAEAPTPGPPGGDPGPQSQPGHPQAIGGPPGLELPAASGPKREGDAVHDGEPARKRPVIDVARAAPMDTDPEAEAMTLGALCEEEVPVPTFDEKLFAGSFHDQYTGEFLPKELVLEGVKRELDEMEEFEVMVWKKRSEKPPGERVISTKLFHTRKGPDCVRSRVVARDFAGGVFVTWALKLVISRLASRRESRQLASHDISVAFFHAQLKEAIWAEPPKELNCPDWLWLVSKALYGMRESSADFQKLVRDACREHGWNILSTVPCLAYHSECDCLSGFHGDDFYTGGEPQQLDKVDAMITGSFKAKILPRVGPAAEDKGLVLRRLLLWSPSGFMLLLDPKHFENLSTLLDLKGAKPSPTPASRATGKNARDALEELKRAAKPIYCRGTGICMYIGPDRFDIQFAVQLLASDMAHPTRLSMMRLRRLARSLAGTHDVGIEFLCQASWNDIVVHSGGDWSGDVQTCKSTPAGAILVGSPSAGHLVESWSVTRGAVALSSAESEFHAVGSAAARGIAVRQVMVEIAELGAGLPAGVELIIRSDSDAARGMIHRVGCGRVRDLQTRYLCHQQALREKQFEIERVDGKKNPSDAGTKALDQEALQACMVSLGIVSRTVAGFGTDEAAQVLAALLLLCATARTAHGADANTCVAGASQTETYGVMIKVFVAIVLSAVGFVTGVLYEKHMKTRERSQARPASARLLLDSGVQAEPTPTRCEEKGNQAPCMYARNRAQPRFVPLP
ncbi:unnamed protein product [Prorocentrum cordatum]|uniref:RNA-directed RNA polymerase n=1 Tax=Prorocentrum cordatum TaxID=2364126 RepID=A0ABN9XPJ5_9DINO|nr:unnamed protein product [Polarella glacialis]